MNLSTRLAEIVALYRAYESSEDESGGEDAGSHAAPELSVTGKRYPIGLPVALE